MWRQAQNHINIKQWSETPDTKYSPEFENWVKAEKALRGFSEEQLRERLAWLDLQEQDAADQILSMIQALCRGIKARFEQELAQTEGNLKKHTDDLRELLCPNGLPDAEFVDRFDSKKVLDAFHKLTPIIMSAQELGALPLVL